MLSPRTDPAALPPSAPPEPLALTAGADELSRTALGDVFQPYLRDYIGSSIGRTGPSAAICPFVRRALNARAMHYTESTIEAGTAPLDVARMLVHRLDWFERISRDLPPGQEQPGLVIAFLGRPERLLPVVVSAHRAVRAAVLDRGCTSALFHEDPPEPADPRHPEPRYFTSPAPFCVLRRIIPADLQLALRVPGMFPAYHRLHAPEARRTRLHTSAATETWHQACRKHGLTP